LLAGAAVARYQRAELLRVLPDDYVRTARAKGVSERRVMMVHVLRNALIPIVTIVALTIPDLVGGAIVTETIFAWPGMGRLFFNALGQFDFALLMGLMCVSAFAVVFANLLADVCYAWLDPRVKYS